MAREPDVDLPEWWDEDFYLKANQSVGALVTAGTYRSGYHHFTTVNEAERGRTRKPEPVDWNDDAYLAKYADVADAVTAGVFTSGYDHYDLYGRSEGRFLPFDDDWNERFYLEANAGVLDLVKANQFSSGYEHYVGLGKGLGARVATPPPADWDEDAYLAANPDVAVSVESKFYPSGYYHFDLTGRMEERSRGLPKWVVDELYKISEIELSLFPSLNFVTKLREHRAMKTTGIGCAFARLQQLSAGKTYSHVFIVPWLRRGGSDLETVKLINALVEHFGARVLMVTTEDVHSPWLHLLAREVDVIEIGSDMSNLKSRDRAIFLAQILQYLRPKVIHIINSRTGWDLVEQYGRAFGARTSVYVCLFNFLYSKEGERVGYARELESIYQNLTGIVTDNRKVVTQLTDLYGYDERKFFPISFPTDIERRFCVTSNSPLKILYASRLDSEKRPDVLFRIADSLPDVTFDVYGAPLLTSDNHTMRWIDGLARLENVIMHGAFDGFESIAEDNYLLMVYTSEADGLPNVILEALGSGLAVIAPDIGGIAEVIPYSSGFLISDCEDVGAYVRKIRACYGDPNIVEAERIRAKRLMENDRSPAHFVEQLRSIPNYCA